MSGRKSQLLPYANIIAGDMSGNITSAVTNIQYEDNVAVFLSWAGTPAGTFDVQVSPDNTASSTWDSLPLSSVITASGSADSAVIDLSLMPFPYMRIVYTRTGSTGTLSSTITAKQV